MNAPVLDEIEITPEMIDAGIKEFSAYDYRFEPPAAAVIKIFLSMVRALYLLASPSLQVRLASEVESSLSLYLDEAKEV